MSSALLDVVLRNKLLVLRYFEAIATSDLEELESLLAPDLMMRCAGGKGTSGVVEFHSFEALAEDLRHSEGELYDPTIGIQPEVLNLMVEENRVAAEVRMRGLSARTGKAYDNLYAFFFWIRDGVITEIHEHLDTLYIGAMLLGPAGIAAGVDMPWLRNGKHH
jgi:ketosteroid isomerase-like protein